MSRSIAILCATILAAMCAAVAAQDVDAAAERARLANERIAAESERRAREAERLQQEALAAREAATDEAGDDAAVPARAGPAPETAADATPVGAPQPDLSRMLEQLRTLGELKDAGYVTDAEFERIKQRILDEERAAGRAR